MMLPNTEKRDNPTYDQINQEESIYLYNSTAICHYYDRTGDLNVLCKPIKSTVIFWLHPQTSDKYKPDRVAILIAEPPCGYSIPWPTPSSLPRPL